jgi:hypothetical protein
MVFLRSSGDFAYLPVYFGNFPGPQAPVRVLQIQNIFQGPVKMIGDKSYLLV